MVDVVAETDPAVSIEEAKKKRKKRCVENNNCEDTPTKMEVMDSKVAVVAPTLVAPLPTPAARKRAHSPRTSPSRKMTKLGSGAEGGVDNETLIRETEAALKSLSGTWPGARASYYGASNHADADDKFENLFDEKHAAKARCAATASPGLGPDSLKDVITLRGTGRVPARPFASRPAGRGAGPRRDEDGDLDDSSQELHMDVDRDEDHKDFKKVPLMAPPHHGLTGYGPYPPRPTFVGFPGDALSADVGPAGVSHVPGLEDKVPPSSLCLLELNLKFEEDDQAPPPPPAAASPDPSSKQYTILQPAAAGSRAATAIQDVTREGLPAVPRAQAQDLHRTFGPLSPASIGRGESARDDLASATPLPASTR
ncbi:Membrane protein insertase YidC [Frankliniella fusca]|uniref:Membrane protein insertase YidC n=1 Tax=Frankliniella fusca TaxID=407009 RepID=A0AAE1HEH5_9NEOP|nr:Membrane protein insertase YidC [Frankliniella fusca]